MNYDMQYFDSNHCGTRRLEGTNITLFFSAKISRELKGGKDGYD